MKNRSAQAISGSRSTQRGVGLIEVMIAFVIVSIGVLAIIGMQVTGKQTNNEAVQRTAASHLAADIIERLRANPTASANYATSTRIGGGTTVGPSAPTAPAACASASPCTTVGIAARDLYDWELSMRGQSELRGGTWTGGLIEPRACITPPAGGASGVYDLVIVWRGTMELPPAALAVCAGGLDNTSLYGSTASAANDRHRRVLRLSFYVAV